MTKLKKIVYEVQFQYKSFPKRMNEAYALPTTLVCMYQDEEMSDKELTDIFSKMCGNNEVYVSSFRRIAGYEKKEVSAVDKILESVKTGLNSKEWEFNDSSPAFISVFWNNFISDWIREINLYCAHGNLDEWRSAMINIALLAVESVLDCDEALQSDTASSQTE